VAAENKESAAPRVSASAAAAASLPRSARIASSLRITCAAAAQRSAHHVLMPGEENCGAESEEAAKPLPSQRLKIVAWYLASKKIWRALA
jgi:hypothetical protein